MRFALIFVFGFILADCQHFYYPSPISPLVYYQRAPLPWQQYAAPQSSADELEQDVGEGDDGPASFRDSPSPRFLFNGLNNNILLGANKNLAFKTLVYTTVRTKTVFTTSLCLPSSNVVAAAPTCSRRRRDLDAFLFGLDKYYNKNDDQLDALQPSPTFTVETTAIPFDRAVRGPYFDAPAISSSKEEGGPSDAGQRVRRFFTAARLTFTSWRFTTTTVNQPVNVRFLENFLPCPVGNEPPAVFPGPFNCAFACIPPGYSVCPATA